MLTAEDLRYLKHDLAVEMGELEEDCWLPQTRWLEGVAALIEYAEATFVFRARGRNDGD